jgi:hypothetical protein
MGHTLDDFRRDLASGSDRDRLRAFGRRLRLGLLRADDRPSLRDLVARTLPSALAGEIARAVVADLDRLEALIRERAPGLEDIVARDDAESTLWVLGEVALGTEQTGVEIPEHLLAERGRGIDAVALARRAEWDVRFSPPRWLVRLAYLNPTAWWLDLAAVNVMRPRMSTLRSAAPSAPLGAPLRLRRSRLPRAAELRIHADVIGCEDDPARLAAEQGAIVARLFDGEIEVLALGFARGQEELPPGLCVRRANQGATGIDRAELRSAGVVVTGFASDFGLWIAAPPEATGPCELFVRYESKEETLPVDVAIAV